MRAYANICVCVMSYVCLWVVQDENNLERERRIMTIRMILSSRSSTHDRERWVVVVSAVIVVVVLFFDWERNFGNSVYILKEFFFCMFWDSCCLDRRLQKKNRYLTLNFFPPTSLLLHSFSLLHIFSSSFFISWLFFGKKSCITLTPFIDCLCPELWKYCV